LREVKQGLSFTCFLRLVFQSSYNYQRDGFVEDADVIINTAAATVLALPKAFLSF